LSRLALAISFVIGVAFGSLLSGLFGETAESPAVSKPTVVAEVEAVAPAVEQPVAASAQVAACRNENVSWMTDELEDEREEVAKLKRELHKRLSDMREAMSARDSTTGRDLAELDSCRLALEKITPDTPLERLDYRRPGDDSFDSDHLVDLGLSKSHVDKLMNRWENAKLEKLYLADKLSRGEQAGPDESNDSIEARLRKDLGEEDYSDMLFATNQRNGVAVKVVLQNSLSYEGGVRSGFVIHSYDGRRVFRTSEIQAYIKKKVSSDVVELTIMGNEGLEPYYVDGGMVGVSFVSVKVKPGSY
jgi:hypothetical protein